MASRRMKRVAEAVARAAQRRDAIEMQCIDRLLSPLALKRGRPAMTATAINRIKHGGFRSILCPVDFSDQSWVALRYAATVARRSEGRLSILYRRCFRRLRRRCSPFLANVMKRMARRRAHPPIRRATTSSPTGRRSTGS